MNNSESLHDIIFVTDKYGRRNKTGDIENKKSIVYTDEEINQIAHFAINLIVYISCFPDCLTDGALHGVKTENNHRLSTSEKVVDAMESVGGVVNPHFRRVYFKRLESDFYKNKKGQIIFVHETVVNAQAKTLEQEGFFCFS